MFGVFSNKIKIFVLEGITCLINNHPVKKNDYFKL